jgi:hypothetical protein
VTRVSYTSIIANHYLDKKIEGLPVYAMQNRIEMKSYGRQDIVTDLDLKKEMSLPTPSSGMLDILCEMLFISIGFGSAVELRKDPDVVSALTKNWKYIKGLGRELNLYRSIWVLKGKDLLSTVELDNVGDSWSPSLQDAKSWNFNGDEGKFQEYFLHTKITQDQIRFFESVMRMTADPEEHEVKIKGGTHIKIVEIYDEDRKPLGLNSNAFVK